MILAFQTPEMSTLCVENLARLMADMTEHPKQINKYVPYLLVDYIELVQRYPLSPPAKRALSPGIYALLSACGDHEYVDLPCLFSTMFKALLNLIH